MLLRMGIIFARSGFSYQIRYLYNYRYILKNRVLRLIFRFEFANVLSVQDFKKLSYLGHWFVKDTYLTERRQLSQLWHSE
jgi:hypothetical protein